MSLFICCQGNIKFLSFDFVFQEKLSRHSRLYIKENRPVLMKLLQLQSFFDYLPASLSIKEGRMNRQMQ